jgi:6-pyruvoyltetrahydropterin/6-carboxytetrahydropterin synthase
MAKQTPPIIALVSRKLTFSAAHFYSRSSWTKEQNLKEFGACFHPHGHGHNYIFEAYISGPIDSSTGLVIDLAILDKWMKEITKDLDHQHLNYSVPEFKSEMIPTTENIAGLLFNRLNGILDSSELKLNRIRLFETDDIWSEVREGEVPTHQQPHSSSTRQVVVRAIHHLESKDLSVAENKKLYGLCYGVHGHHYKVQATLTGPVDQHGLVIKPDDFISILKTSIVDPFDGLDINTVFASTSCELLAFEFFQILNREFKKSHPHLTLRKVGVQETRKNFFEYPPEKTT